MKIDILVAEIGSTTTIVNAFTNIKDTPIFLGQGFAATTVKEGDVNLGLINALEDLKKQLGVDALDFQESLATSSAAGGLKMSVHGLVYDMTAKAAKEAALGAGANLVYHSAGKLSNEDLEKIKSLNLNMIMIAGGVDFGEKETALYNSEAIARLKLSIPVLYAGNIVNQDAVKKIFKENDQAEYLYITKNVYPKIDELDVEEARAKIQKIFEEHIIRAPGMENIRKTINSKIIPTPGAVMNAAILLQKELGSLVVIDIGGATTDVHSVAEDSDEISKILFSPEPFSKRTVEGDLGVYVNKDNLLKEVGKEEIKRKLEIEEDEFQKLFNYSFIQKGKEKKIVEMLALKALEISVKRHAGQYKTIYTSSGKKSFAEGKDLTGVKYIIGTGGVLARLENGKSLLQFFLEKDDPFSLKPPKDAKVLIDHHYIMASLGVLGKKYPQAALKLLKGSLKVE